MDITQATFRNIWAGFLIQHLVTLNASFAAVADPMQFHVNQKNFIIF